MKKIVSMIVVSIMAMSLCTCTDKADQSASAGGSSVQQSEEFTEQLSTDSAAESEAESTEEPATRIITDSTGRDVEIPSRVESIVCVGVGALRYSCYMDAADLVVGVEDYEVKEGMSRLYNYVNFDKFKDLPVTGTNGEPNIEEIITAGPQVIVMSSYASADADDLQEKSGIPVVMVPGSDTTLDDNAYETIRIMGELYGKEDRAQELTAYLKGIQKDLDDRTADIPEEDKPSVYVAGVSFKGAHGFEGTEAYYGPFELIHANNLANTTDQTGAFDIDLEQVLTWDPEIIFLDFNGMSLINEDYADNPDYYQNLTAVKEGKVYSQISFRSSASNLETALADAYYAACIMYPEQFSDIDPVEKAGEIFTALLGTNPYEDLKEAGYEFRQITIGE
ncbi:iron ABC transporter substrate-binding protein [Eisenbergiella tayi]|uniref:iron ABC transporter substrate-binding protein n=1 Tax=Eisenbergiella tayi TaxID=1432052 RepID=UPI000848ED6F|nr:iron ABC transporter substrate-binding protein [Eisenbergiella tayi]ODR34241.1 iron ABC transporter substrate-binding protein [Eisenbergiella tayi]